MYGPKVEVTSTATRSDKWFGILHHVVNEHECFTGAQHCEHDELVGPPKDLDGIELHYFSRAEPAFRALHKILADERWLKSLKYYTIFR